MILAGFLGLIVGGILGGIVSQLNLSLIKAGLYGLIITLFPVVFFQLLSEDKFDENHRRFGFLFIFIVPLTIIFVSFVQFLSARSR